MVEEAPEGSRFEPLSALWRVLAAPQSFMILLGLVALALVVGSLIPQIPPEASELPQAWLAAQPGLLGQGSGLLGALGLYDLYHALWFRLLLAIAGIVLFVRTVDSFEFAWRAMVRRPWPASALAFWSDQPPQVSLTSSLSVQETRAQLSELLLRQGYWLADVGEREGAGMVAGRRGSGLWARPLGYGALLLALLGLTIAGTWGWQGEQWQPVPDESRAVGHDTPYVVRLDDFDMRFGDDQRLEEYSSQVTWLEGDSEIKQDRVEVGRPVMHRGITVRQIGYMPVVRMRAWDEDDQPLPLDTGADALSVTGEAEIRFSSPQGQPLVLVSDRDLILALTFEPMCDAGRPALNVDRIQSGGTGREALAAFFDSGSLEVDGLRLELDLNFVPILRVDRKPGMGLVALGMALVVTALLLAWIVAPSLVWIAVGQGGENQTRLQVRGLPAAGTDRWLTELAARLREELADEA
jgi:hypothetical protein